MKFTQPIIENKKKDTKDFNLELVYINLEKKEKFVQNHLLI